MNESCQKEPGARLAGTWSSFVKTFVKSLEVRSTDQGKEGDKVTLLVWCD